MVNLYKNITLVLSILHLSFYANAYDSKAKNALLMDMESETIVFAKNPDQAMPPSSMSKLMTAYVVFDAIKSGRIELDKKINISEKAWKASGSRMFLELGEEVTVSDLLKGLIVQSGNDAAIALAEGMEDSEESFVNKMNVKAVELGLMNSNFSNATGLPDPHHYMSARDLAILSKRIIKDFPEYYSIFSDKEFTHNNITQPNRNTLVGENGVDGLKTGHTEAGGYGIVMSAERNGTRLIAVVNGLDNEKERMEAAKGLINHGFEDFKFANIPTISLASIKANVWHGDKSKVKLSVAEHIRIVLPKEVNFENLKVKAFISDNIQAPIAKGQNIGELVVDIGDYKTIKMAIKAEHEVEEGSVIRRMFQNAWQRMKVLITPLIESAYSQPEVTRK